MMKKINQKSKILFKTLSCIDNFLDLFQTHLPLLCLFVEESFKFPHERLDLKHKSFISGTDNVLKLGTLIFWLSPCIFHLWIEVRILFIILVWTPLIRAVSFVASHIVNSLQENLFFSLQLDNLIS